MSTETPGEVLSPETRSIPPVPLLLITLLLCSLAGAMAWGIRGQYGHETGAMMFGPLVGFTLVLLYLPNASSLKGARAVAMLSMAVGIGGSMSYGETVGLTHDLAVHATYLGAEVDEQGVEHHKYERKPGQWNEKAYWWGMTGLAVKGGLWIGFAGLFLGVALGGKSYEPLELLIVIIVAVLLMILGMWILNSPFEPGVRKLPLIYFSDHWQWEPEWEVNPRPENWGGVLFAFTGLFAYFVFIKGDRLAGLLGLWGLVGGLGFPIGQSLQAANAADSARFQELMPITYGINTWNLMECTFGFVAGAVIGFGVWLHRKRIVLSDTARAGAALSELGDLSAGGVHLPDAGCLVPGRYGVWSLL
ncbi:MAG: hypothetical protein R3C11_09775 [Planctomycetaceae bacterium]